MSTLHPFTPRTARLLWIILIVVLAATLIAGVFVHSHGPDTISASLGFNAWFGFLACVALVGVSRLLGAILKRGDGYYDN
jgi:preprotein translocase subunit SecG